MLVEPAHQRAERGVGNGFVPMVQRGVEDRLATHEADHRAEDDRHPEQRGKASDEADVAECGEAAEQGDACAKAYEDLFRARNAQCARRSRQDLKTP